MADNWEIKGSVPASSTDAVMEALTLGFAPAPREYTVRNRQTGETRKVIAYSEKGAGEKIAKGKFSD